MVERLETIDVMVVTGNDRNIKITRPSDLALAQFFLSEERKKAETPA
jgi:2-C-methyl-D-erythritol 4-phosphate cytidylyltransferase